MWTPLLKLHVQRFGVHENELTPIPTLSSGWVEVLLRSEAVGLYSRGKQEAVSSLNLSGQQRSLLLAFERLDPKLARMYLGALRVLADEANPDAMPLAAHTLREIMEKLPESLDVPLKASAGALSNLRVAGLLPIWQKAVNRSSCHSNGEWQGQLDGPLERLLKRLNLLRLVLRELPNKARRNSTGLASA